MTPESDIADVFIAAARQHLVVEYLPKLRACVEQLSEDDFWWRATETENSIGNLLLHLSGNIRQWIIGGLGGAPDSRIRQEEFDARRTLPKAEVWRIFESTVMEADAVLDRFDGSKLAEVRHFQKWEHSCLYAISHVVEHVAQHMGQIIFITKFRLSRDLKFFPL